LIQRSRRTSLEEGKRHQGLAHEWIATFEAELLAKMRALPEAEELRVAVSALVADRGAAGICRQELDKVTQTMLSGDPAKLAERRHLARLTLSLLDERLQARGRELVQRKADLVSAGTKLHREFRLAQGPVFTKEQDDPATSDGRLITIAEIMAWVGRNQTYDEQIAVNLADELLLPSVASEFNVVPASKPEGVSAANWDAFLKMQAAMKAQAVGAFK
jgi:hypothetical protein